MIPIDWHDRLLPYLNGAGKELVDQLVEQVAAEFCQQADVWVEELPAIDVEAGQAVYDPVPPTNSSIRRVLAVKLDGALLRPLQLQEAIVGRSTGYHYRPDVGITLYPTPTTDKDKALVVTASLWPRSIDALPFPLLERWQTVIANGVLGKAMAIPGKPFTDPNMAAFYLRQFLGGISEARATGLLGNAPSALNPYLSGPPSSF